MHETRKVQDIVFREDLYPRIKHDPAVIQRYAENLEVLPPIEVNQDNELIDGFHRWTAHRKQEADSINVIVTKTKNEEECKYISCLRHSFEKENSDMFWQTLKKIGIRVNNPKAANLLMCQPFLVEHVMCIALDIKQARRNQKGYDAISREEKTKIQIKCSKNIHWTNITENSDCLLLLQIKEGSIKNAFYGTTERFLSLYATNKTIKIEKQARSCFSYNHLIECSFWMNRVCLPVLEIK